MLYHHILPLFALSQTLHHASAQPTDPQLPNRLTYNSSAINSDSIHNNTFPSIVPNPFVNYAGNYQFNFTYNDAAGGLEAPQPLVETFLNTLFDEFNNKRNSSSSSSSSNFTQPGRIANSPPYTLNSTTTNLPGDAYSKVVEVLFPSTTTTTNNTSGSSANDQNAYTVAKLHLELRGHNGHRLDLDLVFSYLQALSSYVEAWGAKRAFVSSLTVVVGFGDGMEDVAVGFLDTVDPNDGGVDGGSG